MRPDDVDAVTTYPETSQRPKPGPDPRMSLAEFEAVSGRDSVTFAGFRATVNVRENGAPKFRTLDQWRRTFREVMGC